MKVYHIPKRQSCPLRIQMSDDEVVSAIQVRDEQGYAFYWLLIKTETAKAIIAEHEMRILYTLPDTPEAQVT